MKNFNSILGKNTQSNLENIQKIYNSRERSATTKDFQSNTVKHLDIANQQFMHQHKQQQIIKVAQKKQNFMQNEEKQHKPGSIKPLQNNSNANKVNGISSNRSLSQNIKRNFAKQISKGTISHQRDLFNKTCGLKDSDKENLLTNNINKDEFVNFLLDKLYPETNKNQCSHNKLRTFSKELIKPSVQSTKNAFETRNKKFSFNKLINQIKNQEMGTLVLNNKNQPEDIDNKDKYGNEEDVQLDEQALNQELEKRNNTVQLDHDILQSLKQQSDEAYNQSPNSLLNDPIQELTEENSQLSQQLQMIQQLQQENEDLKVNLEKKVREVDRYKKIREMENQYIKQLENEFNTEKQKNQQLQIAMQKVNKGQNSKIIQQLTQKLNQLNKEKSYLEEVLKSLLLRSELNKVSLNDGNNQESTLQSILTGYNEMCEQKYPQIAQFQKQQVKTEPDLPQLQKPITVGQNLDCQNKFPKEIDNENEIDFNNDNYINVNGNIINNNDEINNNLNNNNINNVPNSPSIDPENKNIIQNNSQSNICGNQQVRTFSEVHQLIMNTRLSADKTPLLDGKYGDISGIKEEEEIFEDTQRISQNDNSILSQNKSNSNPQLNMRTISSINQLQQEKIKQQYQTLQHEKQYQQQPQQQQKQEPQQQNIFHQHVISLENAKLTSETLQKSQNIPNIQDIKKFLEQSKQQLKEAQQQIIAYTNNSTNLQYALTRPNQMQNNNKSEIENGRLDKNIIEEISSFDKDNISNGKDSEQRLQQLNNIQNNNDINQPIVEKDITFKDQKRATTQQKKAIKIENEVRNIPKILIQN